MKNFCGANLPAEKKKITRDMQQAGKRGKSLKTFGTGGGRGRNEPERKKKKKVLLTSPREGAGWWLHAGGGGGSHTRKGEKKGHSANLHPKKTTRCRVGRKRKRVRFGREKERRTPELP